MFYKIDTFSHILKNICPASRQGRKYLEAKKVMRSQNSGEKYIDPQVILDIFLILRSPIYNPDTDLP